MESVPESFKYFLHEWELTALPKLKSLILACGVNVLDPTVMGQGVGMFHVLRDHFHVSMYARNQAYIAGVPQLHLTLILERLYPNIFLLLGGGCGGS